MFGLNLDWWNATMLLSLGGGALAAVAIVFTTAVVVKLQKQEAIDAANEFRGINWRQKRRSRKPRPEQPKQNCN